MAIPTHERVLETLRRDRENLLSMMESYEHDKTQRLTEVDQFNARLRDARASIASIEDAIDALVRAVAAEVGYVSHGDGG